MRIWWTWRTHHSLQSMLCVTAAKMPDRRLPPVGPMPAVPVSPERRQVPSLSLMLCHGPQHSTAFHFSPGIAQTPAASGKPWALTSCCLVCGGLCGLPSPELWQTADHPSLDSTIRWKNNNDVIKMMLNTRNPRSSGRPAAGYLQVLEALSMRPEPHCSPRCLLINHKSRCARDRELKAQAVAVIENGVRSTQNLKLMRGSRLWILRVLLKHKLKHVKKKKLETFYTRNVDKR